MSTTTIAPQTIGQPRAHYRAHYRLTRRGRVVVFLLALLTALAIGIAFAGGSVATAENQQTESVVVAPGDTLWDIAADAAAGTDVDIRDMMREITELNGLDSDTLAVGQELEVPAGS